MLFVRQNKTVGTVSNMKVTRTALYCLLISLLSMAQANSEAQTISKYKGLTADDWRAVFSHRKHLSDFDYEGKMPPVAIFEAFSMRSAANSLQEFLTKVKTTDDNYFDYFYKSNALSDQSSEVLADLLKDPMSPSNCVLQRCVLIRIGEGCAKNAQVLSSAIQPYLLSNSVCTQLAALDALYKIGATPLKFTNDLSKCLNSSNRFVRAAAARNLSAR